MHVIRDKLEKTLRYLPIRKRPAGLSLDDGTLDDYIAKKRLLFSEAVLSNNTPEWLNCVGRLKEEGSFYRSDKGLYYWFWSSKTGSEYKKILDDFVDKIKQETPLLRQGEHIGLISSLHASVIEVFIDEPLYKLLREGCDFSIENYEELYLHRKTMGNTIDLSMLCIDNIELGPIFQTFFSKMGSYDDKNDKSSSRAVVKTKLTTLKQKGARFFIHAPYNYNGADTKANNGMMIRELMDSVHVGALGVVVHVGHSAHNTTLPQSVFVDRMITNFKTLLAYATRETPLLLETPPGKERELFTTPWELGDFYLRLSEEERQKSGLVVDTCHVFDAGYDPIVYLHVLNDRAPGSIKLIHFNDSAGPCGCRRDIHFNPGGGFSILKNIVTKCELPKIAFAGEMGYIGPKRLAEVAKWAVAHSVPCVVE